MKNSVVTFSFALFLIVLSLFIWRRLLPQTYPPDIYRRDFIQFYLMGKAAAAHEPIYQPIPDLAARFDSNLAGYHWHPSAYPPAFTFIAWVISRLDYTQSFRLWVLVELVCFVAALSLLMRTFPDCKSHCLIIAALFVLWRPFFGDLYQGQMMLLALLCLTGAWLLIRSGHGKAGGVVLAILLALKLYAWPVLLFLLLARKKAAFVAALITLATINLVAIWWLGWDQFATYAFRVAPLITQAYHSHVLNFSVLALFGPLADVAVLVLALCLSRWVRDFDSGFMIALVVSSVLNPVAWSHYMVTFLPALCWVAFRKPFLLVPVGVLAWVCFTDATITARGLPLLFVFALAGALFAVGRNPPDASLSSHH